MDGILRCRLCAVEFEGTENWDDCPRCGNAGYLYKTSPSMSIRTKFADLVDLVGANGEVPTGKSPSRYEEIDLATPLNKCPKCGSGTTRRMNRKTGLLFVGCDRYPDCSWSKDLPLSEAINSKIAEGDPYDYSYTPKAPTPGKDNPLAEALRKRADADKRKLLAELAEAARRKQRVYDAYTGKGLDKDLDDLFNPTAPKATAPKVPAKKVPPPKKKSPIEKRFEGLDFSGDAEEEEDK